MFFPNPKKRWTSLSRVVAVALTIGLLALVFRRIDLHALRASFARIEWGWFLGGFLVYGLALFLGSLRMHIALRLTNAASHFLASSRIFVVGHFLFLVLFGAAGGDLTRSTVYCRWYRFGFPEVLAASPLDRLLGMAGTLTLLAIIVVLAALTGAFHEIRSVPWAAPGLGLLVLLAACGLLLLAVFGPAARGHGFISRTLRTFRIGARRLFLSPNLGIGGLVFAVLAQAAVSAVFALNLVSMTAGVVPWAHAFWVFPAITVMSCMPFTVAGVGTREIASIALLGLYGVSASDCAAASLLTLLDICLWAGIGAALFWREEILLARAAPVPIPATISAVIPALNEERELPATITRLRHVPEISEIIVVDGGSADRTMEVAGELGCTVLRSEPGRGQQLRLGAQKASGDVVLLVHADSWVPPYAGRAVLDCLRDPLVVAGGFWKRFHEPPLLLLGSRFKCAVRLLLGRRIAGDQALFIRRNVLDELGGVPEIPLMEEFELCRRLRKAGRLALADATILTSPRRFLELGIIRTYVRMWWVTTLYRLGRPPQELARIYNRGCRTD